MAQRKFMVDAREGENLTQQQLAVEMDLSQTAIAAYEAGIRTPKYKTVVKLGKRLGFDHHLFFEEPAS